MFRFPSTGPFVKSVCKGRHQALPSALQCLLPVVLHCTLLQHAFLFTAHRVTHTLFSVEYNPGTDCAGQTLKTTSQRYWTHICHHLACSEKPSGTAGSDLENNSRTKLLTAFSRLTKPRVALYKLDLGKRSH